MTILLVAPSPPPYGGMALQARLLERLLGQDGQTVLFSSSNLPLPAWLERLPGLRACARTILIPFHLWRQVRRVEVVHIFAASWLYFFTVVAPAVMIGRMLRRRVVLNYRGGEAAVFFRSFGPMVRPILRLANVITAPSDFLGNLIRTSAGVPVSIVPNILDTSRFRYRRRTALAPRLLVNRHLEGIYDVKSVLEAFRLVQERHPGASLWVAGDGSQEAYLKGLASDWKLTNVLFLGSVPHQDMPAVCDGCDILINASRVDNFPGALLEASAAGLLVVSTAAGGIPAIYRDRETALLVSPGDWQGLAEAIELALRSPAMAIEIAARAVKLARACQWSEVRRPLYQAYGVSSGLRQGGVEKLQFGAGC